MHDSVVAEKLVARALGLSLLVRPRRGRCCDGFVAEIAMASTSSRAPKLSSNGVPITCLHCGKLSKHGLSAASIVLGKSMLGATRAPCNVDQVLADSASDGQHRLVGDGSYTDLKIHRSSAFAI